MPGLILSLTLTFSSFLKFHKFDITSSKLISMANLFLNKIFDG